MSFSSERVYIVDMMLMFMTFFYRYRTVDVSFVNFTNDLDLSLYCCYVARIASNVAFVTLSLLAVNTLLYCPIDSERQ